jgi:hypothetical protein|tara:strand:+ start:363 stop:749 length:387 start_codon:yes stop_codon:yes gene_type:complete
MKNICLLIIFASLGFSSCQKSDSLTFKFTIQVVDENGTPIQNATVRATAPVVNAIPDFRGQTGVDGIMTDVDGVSLFEYNMPAVLQVTAQKGDNPPAVFGCGYLKLESDSIVNMKIIVLPYVVGVAGC